MKATLWAGALLGAVYVGILALAAVMLALPHDMAVPVVALLFVGAVAMAWREATR
jgi:hypothetical protein